MRISTLFDTITILAVYCEIYTLPPQVILLIHVRMGRAGHHLIVALRDRVERWAPLVLSGFCLLARAALTGDALWSFLG